MKTAIYIEDGVVQLVITPEEEFEKNAINMFKNKPLAVKIFDGSFYDCRGGWIRQNDYCRNTMTGCDSSADHQSLILRIDEKAGDFK